MRKGDDDSCSSVSEAAVFSETPLLSVVAKAAARNLLMWDLGQLSHLGRLNHSFYLIIYLFVFSSLKNCLSPFHDVVNN